MTVYQMTTRKVHSTTRISPVQPVWWLTIKHYGAVLLSGAMGYLCLVLLLSL